MKQRKMRKRMTLILITSIRNKITQQHRQTKTRDQNEEKKRIHQQIIPPIQPITVMINKVLIIYDQLVGPNI